jgi:hypothetical protein
MRTGANRCDGANGSSFACLRPLPCSMRNIMLEIDIGDLQRGNLGDSQPRAIGDMYLMPGAASRKPAISSGHKRNGILRGLCMVDKCPLRSGRSMKTLKNADSMVLSCDLQQKLVSYLGYTGRAANAFQRWCCDDLESNKCHR